MEQTKVKLLTVRFDAEIRANEIPLFRGAVIGSMGERANLLFHNHKDETGFRYSYPLIQYKRIHKKAAIVCLQEGADVIGQFLAEAQTSFTLGKRELELHPEVIVPTQFVLQTWQEEFVYRIVHWLPLNSENYQRYQAALGMVERITLLEQILKANILSMAKGLGAYVDQEITAKIIALSEPQLIINKGIRLMAFNADFRSNFSIPYYAGLGKNASIGYGAVTVIKWI